MAFLAWIPSKKLFLKVQEGAGDNLSEEDKRDGYVYYVLWSTFRAEEIDIDEELPIEHIDGGMVMFKEKLGGNNFVSEALAATYHNAFDKDFNLDDALLLLSEDA